MKKLNVLVTGGGAPGISGTIHALRFNGENREIKIVTIDARNDVVGKYLSDAFYKVPKAKDPEYINAVMRICEFEKIDVILPQVTMELQKFSDHKREFLSKGVKVVVVDSEAMKVSNDKYELMRIFSGLGYKQGKFELISSKSQLRDFAKKCEYPSKKFVVKPTVSNGMRGLRIVDSEKLNLKAFLNEKPSGEKATLDEISDLFDDGDLQLVGMEYFPGKEYTVDVYRSPLSRKTVVIPRSRDVIRTGITFEGKLIKNGTIIEMSQKLSEALGMNYSFGFQYKMDQYGNPHLLECNPRIQGTMIMSVLGGANMIYWSVKESLGENLDLDKVEIKWGLNFKRLWGGIAIYDGQVKNILSSD